MYKIQFARWNSALLPHLKGITILSKFTKEIWGVGWLKTDGEVCWMIALKQHTLLHPSCVKTKQLLRNKQIILMLCFLNLKDAHFIFSYIYSKMVLQSHSWVKVNTTVYWRMYYTCVNIILIYIKKLQENVCTIFYSQLLSI